MLVHQNCLPVRGRYAYVVALVTLLFLIRPVSAQVSVPLTPSDDACVYSSAPTTNFGGENELYINKSLFLTFVWHTLSAMKFDLSGIPDNAIITSAELKLQAIQGSPFNFEFVHITESWDESTITWNTIPDYSTQFAFSETPITSTLTGPGTIYHHFDNSGLKNMVQYWVNHPHLNHGFVIQRDTTNNTATNTNRYSSKEAGFSYWGNYPNGKYTTVDHRPKLIVQYVLPIEIDLMSVTHASGTSSGDGSITVSASGGNGTYTYQWFNSSGNAIGTNSPTISGLNYGWYGVKVTDGLGVESYMSFIVGVECEKVNITYNPGKDYVDDAYITNYRYFVGGTVDQSDNNYGSLSTINVSRFYGSTGYYGYFNVKGLLNFLLHIDAQLKLNKADLKLRVTTNTGTGNNPVLRLITEDWQEHAVTYTNQPTHSGFITKATDITSAGVKTIDTKAFWEHWRANDQYGFFIDLANPSLNSARTVLVGSSDGLFSNRPYVEFEVSIPCQYVELFSTLTGGYYQLLGDKLHVAYDEQYYTGGDHLEFSVYNTSRVEQAVPSVVTEYGDNRITFDMSGLSTGVYTLEVKGKKNRTYYLRFKKN